MTKPTQIIWSDRNGRLEIHFAGIPDIQTRNLMKERGFQWDPPAKCWHLARPVNFRMVRNEPITQDGFEYALEACRTWLGLTENEIQFINKQRDDYGERIAIQSMLEAQGIA